MLTPSAPRISTTNVLFVQSKCSLVVVESTPKSIADDSYSVLNAAPLACAKASLDREDLRKVKVTVSVTLNDRLGPFSSGGRAHRGPHNASPSSQPPQPLHPQHSQLRYMHSEGVPGLEQELERSRLHRELIIAGSASASASASASGGSAIQDPNSGVGPVLIDHGYSPVSAPRVYPPAELPHCWSATLTFGSEKVCRLARDHVTVKGRETRASQQAQYLDILREAISS
jgi:hypothetical protein